MSNPAHETLALATLFNLDYEDTEVEAAGLELVPSDAQINRLARDFWYIFHDQHQGCIPPGIIFLPGEKASLEHEGRSGFGWAPKTWLSASEVDYPDRLSIWYAPTDLRDEGLIVQFPGVLLHTHSRAY